MRTLPWIIATVVLAIVGIASLSETHRLKGRIGSLEHRQLHVHADVREFMIRAALADADRPIVVLGDSITEMSDLPRELCGHPVVNAGVGGMNTPEAVKAFTRLFSVRKVTAIVITLGANDVGTSTSEKDFADLLKRAKGLTPRVVWISDTDDVEVGRNITKATAAVGAPYIAPAIPAGSKMTDGIHFRRAGYDIWMPALESAITDAIEGCTFHQPPS